jgi:DNA topoisomerase-1
VLARAGRFGPYVQLGEMDAGSKDKPRTASLFKTMALDTVTLEEALRLLTLPRVVGTDPSDGEEIVAANGRYGPYIKKGTDTRSLEAEEQLFTLTIDEALAVLAQPKLRGRRAAAPPLKEFGPDPDTGTPIVLKEGRFGPYLTDGTTNVSLPRGETVEGMTPERAVELLAEKRAKGPAPRKRGAKKAPAKKKAAAKKKAPAKKTATQAAAKKTAGKKSAAETATGEAAADEPATPRTSS